MVITRYRLSSKWLIRETNVGRAISSCGAISYKSRNHFCLAVI